MEVNKVHFLKLLIEYRFSPNILFYNYLSKMVDELFHDYRHWRTSGLKVNMTNFENRSSLTLEHNRVGFEMDLPQSTEQFVAFFERAWNLYRKTVRISQFRRFGARTQCVIPVDFTFDELTELSWKKFFTSDARICGIVGKNVQDYMYNVVTLKDDYNLHVVVGPVSKSELPRWYTPAEMVTDEGEVAKPLELPDVGVFIDVDCYVKDPKEQRESTFLDYALKSITGTAQRLRDYVLEAQ